VVGGMSEATKFAAPPQGQQGVINSEQLLHKRKLRRPRIRRRLTQIHQKYNKIPRPPKTAKSRQK